ncbi:homocysteine S-methyltransferase [Kitasatospora sp. NPDC002227]|uniref:homocysteine S-methyltransferase n=1 Tax=Kitasatospora sp. NPDC002227 TaxID=3154773 RepID=UPI0033189779
MRSFMAAVAAGPLVLDGGLSNELAAAGHDLADALWSARLLMDEPGALVAAHAAYFRAGARVAITGSYQASFEGFARRGVSRAEAVRLFGLSVELAREAAGGVEGRYVAASVGPYGAVLADGSEYRGRYGLSVAELERFHGPRVAALVAAGPDVLALETVPDVDEARALLRVVRGLGVPVWLSYSVAGDRTRAGQGVAEAFAVAAEAEEVVAVGVNCCAPEDAGHAVRVASRVSGKPVVVYPNSGEKWDAEVRDWAGGWSFRPEDVAGWVADGARLVGGCCRVGPRQIAALARLIQSGGARRSAGPVAPFPAPLTVQRPRRL